MKKIIIKFADESEAKNDNNLNDIPADDGHQMSQAEIDALIAKLMNQ